MKIKTLLTVGRVSNLPTIWTNVLAAAVLAQASILTPAITAAPDPFFGADLPNQSVLLWFGTVFALSLMYIGGMYLNDAFDARWDRQNNNLRPIVAGDISEQLVWILGCGFLLIAVMVIGYLYQPLNRVAASAPWYQAYYGLMAAVSLALAVVLYNACHKRFAQSAFVMGACRCGVYLIAALLLAELTTLVTLAAMSLLLYIAGLTYLARDEHTNQVTRLWPVALLFLPVAVAASTGYDAIYFWLFVAGFMAWVGSRLKLFLWVAQPDVKACIGGLLAAIPLFDGLMLASVGAILPSLFCLLVFLVIPRLHRWVSGT